MIGDGRERAYKKGFVEALLWVIEQGDDAVFKYTDVGELWIFMRATVKSKFAREMVELWGDDHFEVSAGPVDATAIPEDDENE